jgi:hypothetical protein
MESNTSKEVHRENTNYALADNFNPHGINEFRTEFLKTRENVFADYF